jgi:hypothetical protein
MNEIWYVDEGEGFHLVAYVFETKITHGSCFPRRVKTQGTPVFIANFTAGHGVLKVFCLGCACVDGVHCILGATGLCLCTIWIGVCI